MSSQDKVIGSGVRPPELARSNPEAAAALSKAIRDTMGAARFDVGKPRTFATLDKGRMETISDIQRQRLKENDNITDLFPDIQLAKQIIVSNILAPKDMISGNLICQTVKTLLPDDIQAQINAIILEELEDQYKFSEGLPETVSAMAFDAGSYVTAVFPEAAVDQVINGQTYSAESHREMINEIIDVHGQVQPLGVFGPAQRNLKRSALESLLDTDGPEFNNEPMVKLDPELISKLPKLSLENRVVENGRSVTKIEEISLFDIGKLAKFGNSTENYLEIVDNYQVLKIPKLTEAIAEQRINRMLQAPRYSFYNRPGMEAYGLDSLKKNDDPAKPVKLTDQEITNLVYKNKKPLHDAFTIFPDEDKLKRHSIGRPLTMRIPSEAVIPVYPPGEPSKHRGYFVLVDGDGNWVTRTSTHNNYAGLESMLARNGQTNSLTSVMTDKAHRALSDSQGDLVVDNMLSIYSSIVENDMITRLRNGIYKTTLTIGKDKEWDRIMLARALAGKMTRLVYVPKTLVTYYAFNYHPNGIGRSYMDDVKVMTSLRAILLFGKVMAEMKNAISVTRVDLTLDEEDQDPQKTIETAQHNVMRLRETFFPLGVTSPVDLLQWIQRAGLMFTFKGHPGLPNVGFEFATADAVTRVPESTTMDDLRKQTFMAMGLTPEIIDEGFNIQFATTALHNQAMFIRRIFMMSNILAKFMSDHGRNICKHDAHIRNKIMTVLKKAGDNVTKYLDEPDKEVYAQNKDAFMQELLDRVVNNLWLDLPKPDVSSLTTKAQEFSDLDTYLDKALQSVVSTEVFPASVAGEFSTHADEIAKIYKHHLLRNWMTNNGYLPEIQKLYERDDKGLPANDVMDIIRRQFEAVMSPAIELLKKGHQLGDAVDKDLSRMGIEEGSNASPSTTSSSDTTGTDDFGGGGDDLFGGDNEEGGDETPTSETGTEDEPKPEDEANSPEKDNTKT